MDEGGGGDDAVGGDGGGDVPAVPSGFSFPSELSCVARGELKAQAGRVSFSPDGTAAAVAGSDEDTCVRLYAVPPALFWPEPEGLVDRWEAFAEVATGESVYDFAWYPGYTASVAASCCFVSSCREQPIHLWDAGGGGLRATYRAYNHLDEVVAANSLAFTVDGERLVAGFERALRVFHVARPGRECDTWSTCKTRKSREQQRQRGIISTLAVCPDASRIVAAGSYDGSVGLYDERSGGRYATLRGGHDRGVACVRFSPCGKYVYSGGRKDAAVQCWDMRNNCEVVTTFPRPAATNQRMSFDVDPSGRYLASGGSDGMVRIFDSTSGKLLSSTGTDSDAAASVAFHPVAVLLAVGTGQRQFDGVPAADSDSEAAAGGGSTPDEVPRRQAFSLYHCAKAARAMAAVPAGEDQVEAEAVEPPSGGPTAADVKATKQPASARTRSEAFAGEDAVSGEHDATPPPAPGLRRSARKRSVSNA